MGYQVLARKWRPGKFSELVGQEHVVRAISNALDNDRLHHAYLFTGTRGVGKTTIARIFARSLNCEQGMSSNPCGQCSSCLDIEQGKYVDLIEIDAASRTKVEDTREILDNVQYRPTRGEYKVYLIDEVHMLSKHSFNALLKTLEEPPPHIKFLLATTDPQKLPVTILSRCLQFNLKALTRDQIGGQLNTILKAENIASQKQALELLARSAQGSMRDALSLTDQAIAQGNGEVMSDVVSEMLGLIDTHHVTSIVKAILEKDKSKVLSVTSELGLLGADFKVALAELMSVFHQIALTQFVPEICKLETSHARQIFGWARSIPPESVQLYYQICLQGRKDIEWAQDSRMGFEMTLMRMMAFTPESIDVVIPDFQDNAKIAHDAKIANNDIESANSAPESKESVSEPENSIEPEHNIELEKTPEPIENSSEPKKSASEQNFDLTPPDSLLKQAATQSEQKKTEFPDQLAEDSIKKPDISAKHESVVSHQPRSFVASVQGEPSPVEQLPEKLSSKRLSSEKQSSEELASEKLSPASFISKPPVVSSANLLTNESKVNEQQSLTAEMIDIMDAAKALNPAIGNDSANGDSNASHHPVQRNDAVSEDPNESSASSYHGSSHDNTPHPGNSQEGNIDFPANYHENAGYDVPGSYEQANIEQRDIEQTDIEQTGQENSYMPLDEGWQALSEVPSSEIGPSELLDSEESSSIQSSSNQSSLNQSSYTGEQSYNEQPAEVSNPQDIPASIPSAEASVNTARLLSLVEILSSPVSEIDASGSDVSESDELSKMGAPEESLHIHQGQETESTPFEAVSKPGSNVRIGELSKQEDVSQEPVSQVTASQEPFSQVTVSPMSVSQVTVSPVSVSQVTVSPETSQDIRAHSEPQALDSIMPWDEPPETDLDNVATKSRSKNLGESEPYNDDLYQSDTARGGIPSSDIPSSDVDGEIEGGIIEDNASDDVSGSIDFVGQGAMDSQESQLTQEQNEPYFSAESFLNQQEQPEGGFSDSTTNAKPHSYAQPSYYSPQSAPEFISTDSQSDEYTIPDVSVDFEIPFEVNGKKVIKASQLDTWSQLIEQARLGGLTKQLALNSNYINKGDRVELVISESQKHLLSETAVKAIEESISNAIKQPINVSANIGDVIDTPAAVQKAINIMRQQYAVKTINEDQGVTDICQAFSGTVLQDTIKPR